MMATLLLSLVRNVNRRLLVATGLAVCCWTPDVWALFNGIPATAADGFTKHVVGIYYAKAGNLCTGTLIRSDLLVTAAHCVAVSPLANDFDVLFGLDLHDKGSRIKRQVEQVRIHDNYTKTAKYADNDIALVKFSGPLPAGYAPVSLVGKAMHFGNPATTFVAVGYGLTKVGIKESGGQLRQLSVTGEHLRTMAKGLKIAINASKAGGPCNGDSGGPLFFRYTTAGEIHYALLGVASQVSVFMHNGIKLNEFCEGISFYTDVPYFAEWILENADKL